MQLDPGTKQYFAAKTGDPFDASGCFLEDRGATKAIGPQCRESRLDGKIKLLPVLVQVARPVCISKQTPSALNSSLMRNGASIEIMSMARGLTTGQVTHGQEPRRVHTA